MGLPAIMEAAPAASLRDIIRKWVEFDPKADDRRIADRVLGDLTQGQMVELVLPIIGQVRREGARRIEHRVHREFFASLPPRKVSSVEERREAIRHIAMRLPDKRDLLKTTFALGDGREVEWGKATVDDHRQRLAMLSSQQDGIGETMLLHEAAIEQIVAAGVTSLGDLIV